MIITLRQEARELHLTRYFTGKPCPHGHISERSVSSGSCIACINEYVPIDKREAFLKGNRPRQSLEKRARAQLLWRRSRELAHLILKKRGLDTRDLTNTREQAISLAYKILLEQGVDTRRLILNGE